MRPDYRDITEKAGKPLWFDENGVPRYVEFHPRHCVKTGAEEVVLAEVRCQACGTPFLVALSWRDGDPVDRPTKTNGNGLHYGEPPNIGCCEDGPMMPSDFHRIVEAWWLRPGSVSSWSELDRDAIDAIGVKSEVGEWV